jgi:hypothetical protein
MLRFICLCVFTDKYYETISPREVKIKSYIVGNAAWVVLTAHYLRLKKDLCNRDLSFSEENKLMRKNVLETSHRTSWGSEDPSILYNYLLYARM